MTLEELLRTGSMGQRTVSRTRDGVGDNIDLSRNVVTPETKVMATEELRVNAKELLSLV